MILLTDIGFISCLFPTADFQKVATTAASLARTLFPGKSSAVLPSMLMAPTPGSIDGSLQNGAAIVVGCWQRR
jgi:hypothetical protein